ncbi:MAG: DUF4446 family protein [Lachnospirales bacterium]|nr:DUF4446 family protein [Bacillota bacterium]
MDSNLFAQLGIDSSYIIIGLCILTFILLITVVVCIAKINKLNRTYDYFMRGKDAETLEDFIIEISEEVRRLQEEDRGAKETIRSINRNIRASYQKFGLVRYNAFKGMGGNLSFAMAMLDYTNSGFVLNSVHSREGCYLYLKRVDMGQTDGPLGNEEKEAVEQALGYIEPKDN